jgi:hypothetical protein
MLMIPHTFHAFLLSVGPNMMLLYCYFPSVFVLSCLCVCVCVCVYIYIYIYIERERERERECYCATISCCSRICGDETDSCAIILFRVIDCVLRIMFMYTLIIYMTRQILVV